MQPLLKEGQEIQAQGSGQICRVKAFLGSGTQGEVYQILLGKNPAALKWYFSFAASGLGLAFRENTTSRNQRRKTSLRTKGNEVR